MADLPISSLPSLASPLTTDIFPIVDGSTTYKTTVLATGTTILNAGLPITSSGITVTGSIKILGGITGSITNAVSASYAPSTTFPYIGNAEITGSLGISSSLTIFGSLISGQGGTSPAGAKSHAEGYNTLALGVFSHAEGYATSASGSYSHAEGFITSTTGGYAHAEGDRTSAAGNYSHAEGRFTVASGTNSHAEGSGSVALGANSHAEGFSTIASGSAQHTQGKYNLQGNTTSLMVIGDGTDNTNRHDLLRAEVGGIQITGSLSVTGSATVSYILSLGALNPLPTASLYPNSFAVSASTPTKPYYSDGTSWNALY